MMRRLRVRLRTRSNCSHKHQKATWFCLGSQLPFLGTFGQKNACGVDVGGGRHQSCHLLPLPQLVPGFRPNRQAPGIQGPPQGCSLGAGKGIWAPGHVPRSPALHFPLWLLTLSTSPGPEAASLVPVTCTCRCTAAGARGQN